MTALLVRLVPATADDAASLADLRVLAMRPSLEHLGRFDPERARQRFLSTFVPHFTRHIEFEDRRVGFVVLRPNDSGLLLDHLYIHPDHQSLGLGAAVLQQIFLEADAQQAPLRVGALRDSRSNGFYLCHGFRLVEVAEWDNYYVRDPAERGVH